MKHPLRRIATFVAFVAVLAVVFFAVPAPQDADAPSWPWADAAALWHASVGEVQLDQTAADGLARV